MKKQRLSFLRKQESSNTKTHGSRIKYGMTGITMINLGQQFAFGGITSLGEGLGYLVIPAFSIAGTAVVIYFAIGALRYMMSGGDKQAVESARNMIIHAIIGFILLMVMFLILEFIPEFFGLTGFGVIK